MSDQITADQEKEYIIKSLGIAEFTENSEYPGMYSKTNGNIRTVVDMTAGLSTHLYDIAKKEKIVTDDDAGTLAVLDVLIAEAEDGRMPTVSEPSEVVHVPKGGEPASESPPPVEQSGDVSGGENVPAVPEPAHACAPAEIVQSTAPPAPFVPQGTMIKGLMPGLKEIGKIKIGRKGATRQSHDGKKEYRLPEKLDHFEVVTLYKDDNGDFIPDAAIMGLIGNDAKELNISLLYNDTTLNFFTRYNQYMGGKCKCSGDGETAVQEDGTKIKCNPDTCSIFKAKKCKANGILSVILKDAPKLGGVYKFRTTSINSIRSILSSLFFIQSSTGGILANIPLKMTVAPMSVNPVGSPTAQTIFVVNLEYPGTEEDLHKQTIKLMTERAGMQSKIAELEAQARAAISAPETKEEIEDVECEFYPDNQKEVVA